MADDTYRSQFRLPYDLYERLKDSADKNHRSLNAELVARLHESFDSSSSGEIGKLRQKVDSQEETLAEAMQMLKRLSLEIGDGDSQENR